MAHIRKMKTEEKDEFLDCLLASAYIVGAILFQKNKKGKRQHVGYFSKALNPAERNYNV